MKKVTPYQEKTDSKLLAFIALVLSLYEFFKIDEGGTIAFLPDFYEKYEKEGCPEWTYLYGTKINLRKLFSVFWEAMPGGARKEIEQIGRIKNAKERESKCSLVLEKYNDDIWANVPAILNRKKAGILLPAFVLMNYLLAPAIWGVQLAPLLEKARKGDRDSILKLIQIDKSLVSARWSTREIRRAQMAGDLAYFNDLANALRTDSLKPKKKNHRLSCVLVYCWPLGLSKLTNDDICDFVKDAGIYNGDSDTLYREIKRLGLRKG